MPAPDALGPLTSLARRAATGEASFGELYAEALRILDEEDAALTPEGRAFVDAVRFAWHAERVPEEVRAALPVPPQLAAAARALSR